MNFNEEIKKKWTILKNKIVNNKDYSYYNELILEAKNLIEYAINVISDEEDYKEKNFSEKLVLLKSKGVNITDQDINILKNIKYLDNNEDCYNKTLEIIHSLEEITAKLNKIEVNTEDISPKQSLPKNNVRNTNAKVKTIKASVDLRNYTEKEIQEKRRALLNINFIGLPKILNLSKEGNNYYIEMESLRGIKLSDIISVRGEMSVSKVILKGQELCKIVDYLHSKDIINNNINPYNIIFDEKDHLRLLRFGIPKVYEINKVDGEAVMFTAPEVLQNRTLTEQSDIYSVGSVLYYMVEGESIKVDRQAIFKKCKDKDLAAIIKKALGNTTERYQGIGSLLRDLNELEDKKLLMAKNNLDEISRKKYMSKKQEISIVLIGGILSILIGLYGAYTFYENDLFSMFSSSSKNQSSNNVNTSGIAKYKQNNNSSKSYTSSRSEKEDSSSDDNEEDNSNGDSQEQRIFEDGVGYGLEEKLKVKVDTYKISGGRVKINLSIENNSEGAIEIPLDKIYLCNENNEKFSIDTIKEAEEDIYNINLENDKKKDFTLYFKGYEDSKTLALRLEDINCDKSSLKDRNIEIRIK